MAGNEGVQPPPGMAQGIMGGGGAPDAVAPSGAMDRLMSTPMTAEQQRAVIQQYAPHALQDFDTLQRMFEKFIPPRPGDKGPPASEPTILGYDLDPPEDAPRPLALQALKVRKLLESRPKGGGMRTPMAPPPTGPVNPLMMSQPQQAPAPADPRMRNPLML